MLHLGTRRVSASYRSSVCCKELSETEKKALKILVRALVQHYRVEKKWSKELLFLVNHVKLFLTVKEYCNVMLIRVGAISKPPVSTPRSFIFVLKSTMDTKKMVFESE